jgi:hypothetical protein
VEPSLKWWWWWWYNNNNSHGSWMW